MEYVTCNRCGWVHMGVSADYAQKEVNDFNKFFDSLDKEKQDLYYGGKGSKIDAYLHCMACGNLYTNFKKSSPGDCPDGCTINPIIHFEEKVV